MKDKETIENKGHFEVDKEKDELIHSYVDDGGMNIVVYKLSEVVFEDWVDIDNLN